jgi:ABC-type xylose transport system permease subunit
MPTSLWFLIVGLGSALSANIIWGLVLQSTLVIILGMGFAFVVGLAAGLGAVALRGLLLGIRLAYRLRRQGRSRPLLSIVGATAGAIAGATAAAVIQTPHPPDNPLGLVMVVAIPTIAIGITAAVLVHREREIQPPEHEPR